MAATLLAILDLGTHWAQRPAFLRPRLHTAAREAESQDHEGRTFPQLTGPHLQFRRVGGWDSNPGPADYESAYHRHSQSPITPEHPYCLVIADMAGRAGTSRDEQCTGQLF
jgi:hypothetical protein